MTIQVAILAFPGVQLLDIAGPADVFMEAARQLNDASAYRVQIIGTEPGPFKSSSGLSVTPDATLQTYRGSIDTLLVAGSPDADVITENSARDAWLRKRAKNVRRIGSVCTGALILGMAGLLEGKRITTHWNSAEKLAAMFPQTEVDPDCIYLRDGQLYTSAGVTAGMDLALAMVEEDYGRELALRVAREMVMFVKRPGGQSQYSTHLAAQQTEGSAIGHIQAYVLANLRADLSVPALAERARMSERSFSRIFKAESGSTPASFVEAARLDQARRLIEEQKQPLKRIAQRCGFSSLDAMRKTFMRRISVGPAEYRRRFADKE
ncbi:GlxA family transcriptional regulator [Herminiimonas sp. KBW02]|uniref:GlxA family transcriptional regulator n=1 Tax=Herminiimonas sp. KBW02 TaxID=2153363 RepID=UPI0018F2BEE8|nr:GlxA family transcriptional regulator [Herminiimonas sp. KBW02]